MLYFIEIVINGAVSGSLYALVALAFVVVYKASRIVNFALGELIMVATGLVATGIHVLGIGLIGSIGFAFVGMTALAAAFNYAVLRHLLGHSLVALLMVTIGFGAFLRAAAAFAFGGVPRSIELPLPARSVEIMGLIVSPHELIVAGVAVFVIALVSVFFKKSRTGIALRAISDDEQAAMAMGIGVQVHFAIAWALAGAIAVVGGVLWTFATGGGFSLVLVGLKVFPIVIIGGLDSIPGVIVGAMLIGILESVAAAYLDPMVGGGMSNVTAFAVLILMLLFRPYGFFGVRDIERV